MPQDVQEPENQEDKPQLPDDDFHVSVRNSENQQEEENSIFDELEERRKEVTERKKVLRSYSINLDDPSKLRELENVPAYKRNNVQLEDTPRSEERLMSDSSVDIDSENDQPDISLGNPYFRDPVD